MVSGAPAEEYDESHPTLQGPEGWATGMPAVAATVRHASGELGALRGARTLLRLNQVDGFDCPGCAWPDPSPEHRKTAEFCENGAKHVAAEATRRHVPASFFAEHPLPELAGKSDWWLEQQGRLTFPLVKPAGEDRYHRAGWDEALDVAAAELRGLGDPDLAAFYTSGRASNEAAFVYQLMARAFGTNNLPDCSNLCHEPSSTALGAAIGVGKGSCTIADLEGAELIVIAGQNPGSNHPRMLTHLEVAKRRGARIVSVNPLPEAGLLRFKNPQTARGLVGRGTPIADEHLSVRLAGDQALFVGVGKLLVERGGIDRDFVDRHTAGFDAYAETLAAASWADIESQSGLGRADIERLAAEFLRSERTIVCWSMGLTQHRNAVASIREIVNVLLLQGNIGKPGAGVFPVRGHSNVQGDRTMGIWERMPDAFLDGLAAEFGFEPPRRAGYDAVDTIVAMRDGRLRALTSLGGNLVRAVADSGVAEDAVRRLRLSVSVATKLNRSHVVTGEVSVVLPCLGRSERDVRDGVPQVVTVEDSVGAVHASQGRLAPASDELRSEVAVVCALAARLAGGVGTIDWHGLAGDYRRIRDHVSHVVPGFEAFNDKVALPGGFLLPHPPRDSRTFPTATGKANFAAQPLGRLDVPAGRLLLQTMRSHDQFNTTVYGYDDRYRGVHGTRHVVLVNDGDLAALGLADGDRVDVVGEADDGIDRRMPGCRVVAYPTPPGCAAAYYPEANVLVPITSTAAGSNTPASKSVIVRLERSALSATRR